MLRAGRRRFTASGVPVNEPDEPILLYREQIGGLMVITCLVPSSFPVAALLGKSMIPATAACGPPRRDLKITSAHSSRGASTRSDLFA